MIRYQRISGITVDNTTGLPSISRTPEGLAMGGVPGWNILMDPSYSGGDRSRNRAAPNDNPQESYKDAVILGEFPNGVVAYDSSPGEGETRHRFNPSKGQVNPQQWSVFTVAMCGSTDNIPRVIRPSTNSSDATPMCLNVGWSSTGGTVIIYEDARAVSGNPQRLHYNLSTSLIDREQPSLIMYTFSTLDGLKIFDGGQLVASDSSDKRPLENFLGVGDLDVFHNCVGLFGMTGLINIDLGLQENTGHRRAIERFLMDKYDIPEGPQ